MRVVVKSTLYGKTQINTYEGIEMPTPKWVEYPALALSFCFLLKHNVAHMWIQYVS